MRGLVTALVCVLGGPAGVAADLGLDDALRLASERNREVQRLRLGVDVAAERLNEAEARRWPSLELSHRTTRLDDDTVERANAATDALGELFEIEIPPFVYPTSHRTAVDATVPVWTAGRVTSAIDAARSQTAAAAADEEAAVRAARLATVARFFRAAAATEVVRARQSALDRAERRRDEFERRLEVGLTTRQEILRWRVEVERARAGEADAVAAQLIARLELADTLDLPLAALGALRMPADARFAELERWSDTLDPEAVLTAAEPQLEALPEVRAAAARAEAAARSRGRVQAELWPRLDAGATYGWLENDTLALDGFDEWSAVLQLSVPVDLRGEIRSRIRLARAEEGIAGLAVDQARAAIRLELGAALAELARTRTRLVSARRAAEESRQRRALLGRQYDVGVVDLLDLVDADSTLVGAEVALATARAEFAAAVARLELVWPAADPPRGGLVP